ncbi:hypothetical protein Goarm_008264, partial [Gossypium armourianum]|nr:hypothetical protein [Gossypium armourianum]
MSMVGFQVPDDLLEEAKAAAR